ncbi:protein unc-79 homolog isoform X19 [Felis catus]|nr:protein unc-79 homolog isoform X19 [Felis catus]XP_044916388.1 protein unc-79 homolog isoform X19 [Felis catus]XP_044916389.1 protein unc-79 homolog isoform X19 [Felis catus]XP_044916390.1 protein unc-79 homolog isoform X19 [Felis catus]XP_044916391.1 protein unc-79 homolog isoform X19 [Felis catus]XP_044916392.1 protein unc-79 homolog isoform X19 [Felis catus]XP_044916393.1 protein unc-79 homolog isoform X19 [Felis catus]XP_044916394.1 protein unc-79 homolog isoform X19 [Felis catus]XP_
MTMCLFPVPFPLTPSLRPQVSSINPTVTRSLLYSVLRDAPSERGLQSRDAHLSDYPSLDYQGLYVTLVTLLDLVPLLQHGQHDLGQSIFYTTTCLLPFLNDDILSTLPYTMISTLATFPPFLHKDIIEYLSTSFLPMAILGSSRREGVPAHVNLSASSMLMIAMQYTSNPVYHCQLLECLMKYKQEVWKDLLYVIAYGPSQVKPPAVQMLFHYWPNLKPPGAISEYRGLQYTAWNPIHCQHIECHNAINKPAVKMCIDPSLSVALGDKPPPLYLCEECSQRIAGDHSEWLIDVLLPQAEISAICQKKNCSSHVRRAVVTCFSAGCCGRHGNRPVRYCKRCHSNHHSNEVGAASETHLYQTSPPPINTRECGAEELVCAVEAVISLLKEAEFHAEQREYELNRRRQLGLSSSHHSLDNTDFDNKDDDKHDQRLLSQFGIWFLVSLCTPSENTPTESLARLVAMVFQWFHSTAYMMDDEVGSLVEKLKPQFVTKWLKTVCDVRFDVMVMCLLPKPMEFARVGGYWDKSCSTVTQLKEGLNRILCLIPYNVISQSVWECIMPEWLEAIRTEVPDNQLKEFREVLSKMFDIELCPLPFSLEEMFGFISCRFTGYPSSVQEQALLWLHVLSELDIMVPLQLLISMFSDGVNSVKELANQRKSRVSELAGNLAARRVSVASDPGRRVQHNMLSPFHSPFQSPFRSPMRSPFRSPFKNFGHPGGRTIDFDCEDDEMNLNCFILMFDLLLKQMELQDDGITMGLEHSLSKDIISIINNVFQAPWGGSHTCQKEEKAIECNLCQSSILCYQLACELLERLAPKEESRLVEPTDSLEDSLLSSRPEFIIGPEGEEEENPATKHGENPGSRAESTEHAAIKNDTERKFCYQQLPVTLRLIYTIFQEMAKFEEPDILFNMLNCLKILCLHGECLYIARKDHPQFLAYIQDHMLIASLWRVVKSEFSQLSSLAVPLLLHALSLPHGADIFWTIINGNFNSKDWKMRFEAVEKVAVICRFLDIHSVTKNHLLKYSLAHAFCCFLTAVEDVNPAVATRAGLLLDTIKRPALQGLCLCLDFQFDTVVKDRPTILSKLLLLHFLKQDIPALSWEFFVNRFETLSLEAQLHLDCNKEFPFPTTITAVRTNVANLSDAALWKIKRARFARNRQKSVRSLRDSVKGPVESKRALSLPETLTSKIPMRLTRHEQSAPALGGTPEQTPGQQSPENDNTIKDLLPEDAGIDHQTVHQLITVLMKFMAKDESSAESDISSAKAFNTVKRHLYVLLGYDQQEGCFMIAPQKMRLSTCFNAFIAGIAQVMDYNINLGKHLLPLVVQVLKYCSCPQLRHYFQQPPRCSLWSLKPHIRQMWLKALLVILYKYPYRDCDISKVLLHLIHITVNTLNAQYHSCKPHATAGPLYSDNSNISRYSEKEKEEDSVFDESDIHDTPTGPCNKESQTFFARLKRIGGSKMVKYQPVEMNVQRSEIELAEYRETGALQDSILHCVREESIQKKKLRSLKQKSLDIGNADSLLFTLDEHRRKSCIDRCDLDKPPVHAAYIMQRHDHGRPRQNSATRPDDPEPPENPAMESFQEARRPVIPEVRLNCMETFEVKVDSPVKPAPKEDLDLIDLSSDSTSGPEKRSVLSTSDSDSLVFEPLPPLRIVESDEEEETTGPGSEGASAKKATSSPSVPSPRSVPSLSTPPLVQVSVEDCSKDFSSKDSGNNQSAGATDSALIALEDPADSAELSKLGEPQDFPCGSPLTLKQKRDLLQKSYAVPEVSLDDSPEPSIQEEKPSGPMPSSGVKTVLLKVPEDAENPVESEKGEASAESDTEQNPERKTEEEGAEESEFKIQIVPRQRKQRKIAVSAIQREYLDISFNILDKLGEQKDPDPSTKGLSTLEMPRESSSAPTLEAGVPETSSHSSISTQYRQMKRGSLGALTMSQLMKRQLEHQSSAPHNISNWDTEQIQPGKRQCNVPMCLNPDLEGQPLRMRGATKSSLLSAPSIVSMFVPAPEEFTDEQPTVMTDKCHDCGAILEEYDEETLGLAIVVLSTFIHLSPDLAAPLLLDIMQSVGRLASSTTFSNQAESMMVPGNAAGVAKQFLRCIFHQLAPNGIFPQLFQSTIKDGTFLRTLATSLMDFNELSSLAALSQLLEGLNNKKNLPAGGAMIRCLENIATFMEALPMDSPSSLWTTISNQFQTFFAKLPCVLPLKCSLDSSLRIMICLLKIPSTNATRSLLEPFSKLLSFVIQNAVFTLAYLVEVCGLCYRAFTKERDKFYLSRSVVLELLQALKLKSPLPDTNLLLLVQFICADAGTKLAESTILSKQMIASVPGCGTAAMECVRQYINEVLDFMADMHTLTKLKSHMKTCSQPLHEDTFGGHLKVGLAQITAMEISRGNHRDNKAVIRYLPWLYHPPSAMQQGPKEFIECISRIRLLSWLLLGSLTHNAVCPNASSPCLPIPLDAGSHIADHLIVILIGFPEQSKTSVLHMCSLFHAFIFAQLWTVYCEQSAVATNVQSQNEFSFTAILTALEFWSRVTPSILQLMAHNKVMVEMVCLHVISLMEALQECNSTIFVKLIPMWLPMIQSNTKHLSAGLQLRLQAIQNHVNHHSLRTLPGSAQSSAGLVALRKWLQCTQFKMAQVEIQSSEAASQFYPL